MAPVRAVYAVVLLVLNAAAPNAAQGAVEPVAQRAAGPSDLDEDLRADTVDRSDALQPVQVNDPLCGQAPSPAPAPVGWKPEIGGSARVVGGSTARPGAFPWIVALTNYFSLEPFCGAAIVNELYVVTAAHCVHGRASNTFRVLANKLNRTIDANEFAFGLRKIIRHPDYNPRVRPDGYIANLSSDIALLQLESSIRALLRDGPIRPVCLPTARCDNLGASCFLDRTVTLAGWGSLGSGAGDSTGAGPKPKKLQFVNVKVTPNDACHAAYQGIVPVTSRMLCASAPGRDTCQGDSGGPMTLYTEGGQHVLVGVVSFGKRCASPDYPGVYTRVSEFSDWIIENSEL